MDAGHTKSRGGPQRTPTPRKLTDKMRTALPAVLDAPFIPAGIERGERRSGSLRQQSRTEGADDSRADHYQGCPPAHADDRARVRGRNVPPMLSGRPADAEDDIPRVHVSPFSHCRSSGVSAVSLFPSSIRIRPFDRFQPNRASSRLRALELLGAGSPAP